MRPHCALRVVVAVSLAGTTARAEDLDFTAERACLSPGTLTLTHLTLDIGDAHVTAGEATIDTHGPRVATEVTVRPCRCVPLGLSARRVTLLGNDALVLDGARWFVGGASLPLAPRWWVVWGQRVGALLPRVEVQGGHVAVGPGVHIPLGNALAVDAWVLARTDGATIETEFRDEASALRVVALGTPAGTPAAYTGTARGALSWTTGAAVSSVRADGATTDAAGTALARTPAEALRGGNEVAFGTAIGHNAVAAADIAIARMGTDVGEQTLVALAGPTLVAGNTVLSARAYGSAWIDGHASTLGDMAIGITSHTTLGPLDASGYARTEVYGTRGVTEAWTGLARAGGTLGMSLGRRFGAVAHRLSWSLGAGVEGGTVRLRLVPEAQAISDFRGNAWRWILAVGARASSGSDLPIRGEAHTELRIAGVSVTGGVTADTVLSEAHASGGWVDDRGDRVSIGWVHRARSAWDLVPSWDRPATGSLDLAGVRARWITGETARAAGAVAMGPVLVRAEAMIDAATGNLVVVGGGARWLAACGCAWVEAAGFRVTGGDLVGLVNVQVGRR